MAAPGLLLQAALRPWSARPGTLAAAVLPPGRVPTAVISEGLEPLFRESWPKELLWICAVCLTDGRRMVFGRDDEAPRATVAEAVAASCAIPGYFAPVEIGGSRFVDGGAHSICNLDLAGGHGLDLVLVSAPMAMAGRAPAGGADGALRRFARTQLGREALTVRRRGTAVIAFQPTAEDRRVMGLNAMDADRRAPVARQVRASTLRRLERRDVVERLAPLRVALKT